MNSGELQVWNRWCALYVSSLNDLYIRGTSNSSSLVLPLHGSLLGGLESAAQVGDVQEAIIKERIRREKVLFTLHEACKGMRLEFDSLSPSPQFKDDFKKAMNMYESIANNITLDTPNELLQMYFSIVSVKPYSF